MFQNILFRDAAEKIEKVLDSVGLSGRTYEPCTLRFETKMGAGVGQELTLKMFSDTGFGETIACRLGKNSDSVLLTHFAFGYKFVDANAKDSSAKTIFGATASNLYHNVQKMAFNYRINNEIKLNNLCR